MRDLLGKKRQNSGLMIRPRVRALVRKPNRKRRGKKIRGKQAGLFRRDLLGIRCEEETIRKVRKQIGSMSPWKDGVWRGARVGAERGGREGGGQSRAEPDCYRKLVTWRGWQISLSPPSITGETRQRRCQREREKGTKEWKNERKKDRKKESDRESKQENERKK